MEPLHVVLILLTGGALGFINNLAGAAGALGLIVFTHLLGMEEMAANAHLRPAALSLAIFGMIGFRSKGRHVPPRVWAYALLTVPGAVLGSLLVHPEFTLLFQVTLLSLIVFVLLQTLRNKKGATPSTATPSTATSSTATLATERDTPLWLLVILFSWLGAHMGFVQVATGLVSIFILTIVHSKDLVQINAAKMAFVLVAALTSNVTLAAQGTLTQWRPALILAIGAGFGSFLASRWSVEKGHGAVRAVVLLICVAVLVHLGVQMFGATGS